MRCRQSACSPTVAAPRGEKCPLYQEGGARDVRSSSDASKDRSLAILETHCGHPQESGPQPALRVPSNQPKAPPDGTRSNSVSAHAAQRAARLPILAPLPDRRWRSSLAKDGTAILRRRRSSSFAGALAVPAPWPAAGPPLAFLQLLLGPADAAFSGYLLPGVLNPADELVSGQRRDVVPSIECRRVGNQRIAQVCGKLVHYPAGHSLAVHGTTVAVQDSDALTCRGAQVDGVVRSAEWFRRLARLSHRG